MNGAYTWGVSQLGVDSIMVKVEAHISAGLPNFNLVGLPDTAIREAKDRVRAAVNSCTIKWPDQRTVVNLSPASVPKAGSGFDLAMAVAVLAASGAISGEAAQDHVHLAELGLNGSVLPIRGILPMVQGAVQAGRPKVVVSSANQAEAELIPGAEVTAISHLGQLVTHYGGAALWNEEETAPAAEKPPTIASPAADMADIKGQMQARHCLEVAAAGGHHLLMIGAPGTGKTMLAQRLPTILPDLSDEEAVEVSAIHSLAATFCPAQGLIRRPPLQSPHHSATLPALVGGGSGVPRPGAVSLAHRGVLFLDEAPEFNMRVLDSLRQPLENGLVTIHRAAAVASYPSRFQLVLAANPCPCGYAGSRRVACKCTPWQRRRYLDRLSGPLLDRIDIQIQVDAPSRSELDLCQQSETSAQIAQRVALARQAGRERWAKFGWKTNAEVPGPTLFSAQGGFSPELLGRVTAAVECGKLTLRGAGRVLRLAWTLADLAGKTVPGATELGAAMSLRVLREEQ